MKLKEKLKNWLFADDVEKINTLENKVESLEVIHKKFDDWFNAADRMYNLSHEAKINCESAQNELVECRKLLNQICDVGVDVGFMDEEHSWAVVCIAGKPEYVKFLPLTHRDARGVLDFLKQFQYSRQVIDSPIAFRNMVKDRLLER